MATKKKEIGSIKRVGARYGRLTRHKVGKMETVKRQTKKCPYCNKEKVKRLAAGIWECGKCGSKFTAGAYTIRKKLSTKSE